MIPEGHEYDLDIIAWPDRKFALIIPLLPFAEYARLARLRATWRSTLLSISNLPSTAR